MDSEFEMARNGSKAHSSTTASTVHVGPLPQYATETPVHSVKTWHIFTRQSAGHAVLGVICIVLTGILHFVSSPSQRPVYAYDAAISYPFKSSTVPTVVAVLIPALSLALTVVFSEMILHSKQNREAVVTVSAMLHWFLVSVWMFFYSLLCTEALKNWVGRLRPRFLDICKPLKPYEFGATGFPLLYGTYAHVDCSSTDSSALEDARKSFPSGHSSAAMSFCMFCVCYTLWTVFIRNSKARQADLSRWRRELEHCLGTAWVVLNLAFAIATAGSRVLDNAHHPSDVVMGLFVGALAAWLSIIPAVNWYNTMILPLGDGE